ncbi:MAG: glycosyltransferase family 4 protein [Deltaproteobacteria bacterium]|nr:glycosyltransferase family 4 protein [Deltaproteobacteria bacterium]
MNSSAHQPVALPSCEEGTLSGKRVLFVVNDPAFFVSHRVNVASGARRLGAEVFVATPPGPAMQEIERLGFRHTPIELDRWSSSPQKELLAVRALVRCYRALRPDLVHHVTIKPVIYGSWAARIAGVSAVVNAVPGVGQVFTSRGARSAARRMLVKALYRTATRHPNAAFIFQNPDDRAYFENQGLLGKCRARLIRGAGVSLGEFQPSIEPELPVLIILPSRMLVGKGIREFVEAASLLRLRARNGSCPQMRFALVGPTAEGNPSGLKRSEIEAWARSGIVEYWGERSDMPTVLSTSHIVCLPSFYGEGIPKVLIEAAASGRPVITTDTPGCREIVRDGVNGVLVAPRDVEALTNAIEMLSRDRELRVQMGMEGRAIVEKEGFSDDAVVRDTMTLYHEVMKLPSSLQPNMGLENPRNGRFLGDAF